MRKLFTLLLGTSLLLVSACNSPDEVQEDLSGGANVPVEESTQVYKNADFAFSVEYPFTLVLDENALWTKEDWEFKNSSSEPRCEACQPMVTIQAESLNGLSLEEFIVKDHSLGDFKTLDETEAFNKEGETWTYEKLNLGAHEFLRVEIPENFHVIQYYTAKEDTVLSFLMYFEEDDNEVVKDIMSSLEFDSK